MDYSKTVAQALLDRKAFKISLDSLFTWTSGIKSPVYCDLRALISDVEGRKIIVEAFVEMIAGCDIIAGTATAGIPWAAWIAEAMGKPMVYVRSSAKEHGTKQRVEGMMSPGMKVALIEDHISTGKSSVEAVEALRDEGAVVTDIFAINTYQLEKAAAAFAAANVEVHTVTSYSTILEVSREAGLISEEQEKMLASFREGPAEWAAKNGL